MGFPLIAGRDACVRGGAICFPQPSSVTPTVQFNSSLLYTGKVCNHDCMYVEDRQSMCRSIAVIGYHCM